MHVKGERETQTIFFKKKINSYLKNMSPLLKHQ